MSHGSRMLAVALLFVGVLGASVDGAENSCVTLRCTNIINGGDWDAMGARQSDRTLTICKGQKRWHHFEENETNDLVSVDEKMYVLLASELRSADVEMKTIVSIDRQNGMYTSHNGLYRGSAMVKDATFTGHCDKVPLRPIPKDAGKPKF